MRSTSSLVDDTEVALRGWLASGTHRSGDRLPPELELAAMLGVSRGTLRTALDRLEESGEIMRRQGSGTYVGRLARPPALREGLEVLRPYSELAQRRGVVLAVRELTIAEAPIGASVGTAFGLPPDTLASTITRTLLADGEPVALMRDVVRPGIALPSELRLRQTLADGRMVLDVLLEQGVSVQSAVTRVRPRLLAPHEPAARALQVAAATAVLELEEVMHVGAGEAVQYASDLFAPNGIDLRLRRNLHGCSPAPPVRAFDRD